MELVVETHCESSASNRWQHSSPPRARWDPAARTTVRVSQPIARAAHDGRFSG